MMYNVYIKEKYENKFIYWHEDVRTNSIYKAKRIALNRWPKSERKNFVQIVAKKWTKKDYA